MIGLRLTSRVTKRTFISLRTKPLHLPPRDPTFAIPSHAVVDEERCPRYTPQVYYTAITGEILANNYQLLAKIGWGMSSTVWLARDIRRHVLFMRFCSRLIGAIELAGIDGSPREQLP